MLAAASAEEALDEDRISATKGKSCTNVLPTLLTSAFQTCSLSVMVTRLLSIFLLTF